MKLIILLIFPVTVFAQMNGNWQGMMTGNGGSLSSTMQISLKGNQLTGMLNLFQNGQTESYRMDGSVAGNKATGKLILNNQEGMTFVLSQNGNALSVSISISGQPLVKGSYTKAGAGQLSPPKSVDMAGANRDPAILGKWYHETTWTGGSNTEYYIFNADGTMDGYKKGYVAAYSKNANASSIDEGSKIADVEQLKSMGARWYTKNNQFCVKFNYEGKLQDKCTSRYGFVEGILKLTDLNSGKVVYYRRAR